MEFVNGIKSSFTRALDSVPAPTVSGLVCTSSSGMPLVSVNWSLLPGPTNLVRGSTMSETYFNGRSLVGTHLTRPLRMRLRQLFRQ